MAYHSRLSLEQVISRRVRENKPIGNNIAFRDSVHKTSKGYKSSKNSTYNSLIQSKKKEKGKHASSTESRRLIWEQVVWPLVKGSAGSKSSSSSIREKQAIFHSSRIPYQK